RADAAAADRRQRRGTDPRLLSGAWAFRAGVMRAPSSASPRIRLFFRGFVLAPLGPALGRLVRPHVDVGGAVGALLHGVAQRRRERRGPAALVADCFDLAA